MLRGVGIALDRPIGVEHLARHEGTVGTGLAALNDKGHRNLGVVIGRIADEDSVVDDVFTLLGSPGLGRDALGLRIVEEIFRNRAVVDGIVGNEPHTLLDRKPVEVTDAADLQVVDVAQDLRLAVIDQLVVVIAAHVFEDRGGVAHAAVGDGGAVLGKLDGGEDRVGLADAGLQRVTDSPLGAGIVGVVGAVGHVADGLRQFDAGVLAETVGVGEAAEVVDAQLVGDGVEEVVAGVEQRVGHVQLAVRIMLAFHRRPDPALRRIAVGGVFGEDAVALDLVLGVDDALGQRRRGGAGLEGRAGGVGAHQRAVEQRGVRLFKQRGIVFDDGRNVISRPARDRERLAALDIDDDAGRARDLPVTVLKGPVAERLLFGFFVLAFAHENVDAVGQDTLHLLLQHDVERDVDVVAGLGLLLILVGQHGAGGGARHEHLAVVAVEIVFKGVLDAVLADHGVGGVLEQRVFFIFLLRHQTRVAEDVRGIVRLIVAGERALDLDAGELGLHDRGDQLHARILDKDVFGGVDRVADVDGIAQPGDLAHLLGGVVAVNVIARAHIAQKLDRGRVGRQALFLVLEISLEHRALDLGHVRVIVKRRLHRDRQIVDIGVAKLVDHVDQLQQNGVRILTGKELGGVDRQVIAFLVADQHAAVAVEDVAARGGDGLLLGLHLAAGQVVLLALDDLHPVEEDQVDGEQQDEQHRHGHDTLFGNHFVHRQASLIRSIWPAGSRSARPSAATTASAGSQSTKRKRTDCSQD